MRVSVDPAERVEFTVTPWSWPFTEERRAEIDAYFAHQQRSNPALWNGRLLLLRDPRLVDRVLHGTLFETDYASLLAGLETGAIGDTVKACFGVAALASSDGAYVVGVMAPHTRNAGEIYFPSGSLDPGDVADARVDMLAAIQRELTEETGLTAQDVETDPSWIIVHAGPRLPVLKTMRAAEPAEALKERILANLGRQQQPEFTDIGIVRSLADVDLRMPSWMRAFFAHIW